MKFEIKDNKYIGNYKGKFICIGTKKQSEKPYCCVGGNFYANKATMKFETAE